MLRRNGLGPRKAGIQPRGFDVHCECSPAIQIDLSEKVRYQFRYFKPVERMTKTEQSLEQTIKILAEKSNAGVEAIERAEFELGIVTAVSNTITQEKLSKEAEMFPQGLSPKTLNFGLKKKHNG